MKSKKNGLAVCSSIFTLISLVMIAMPYIVTPLLITRYEQTGANAKFGVMAFLMTFGVAMTAFGFFSWVVSVVLFTVCLVYDKEEIKTDTGCGVVCLNAICFLYYAFIIYITVCPLALRPHPTHPLRRQDSLAHPQEKTR